MTSTSNQSPEDIDRLGLTVFQQDWWLKIAKGSARLKEVQIYDANGAVIGNLRYIVRRDALGIPSGGTPDLSRVTAPIVGNNLSDEEKIDIFIRLIRKLPNIQFTFSVSEHTPNAHLIRQAFEYTGFECFERLNYSQGPDDVITLGTKVREHIKQARGKLNVIDIDPDTFINFYRTNLEEFDSKSYFSLDVAKELIAISINRSRPQARIIAASRKRSGQSEKQPVIDAAICIVWDNERCYYLMSTRCKESHPNAVKLLIVTAMNHARELGLIFDADGGATPGTRWLFKTILGMPNEERRYIFIRTPILFRIYQYNRFRLKKLAISLGLR